MDIERLLRHEKNKRKIHKNSINIKILLKYSLIIATGVLVISSITAIISHIFFNIFIMKNMIYYEKYVYFFIE